MKFTSTESESIQNSLVICISLRRTALDHTASQFAFSALILSCWLLMSYHQVNYPTFHSVTFLREFHSFLLLSFSTISQLIFIMWAYQYRLTSLPNGSSSFLSQGQQSNNSDYCHLCIWTVLGISIDAQWFPPFKISDIWGICKLPEGIVTIILPALYLESIIHKT